MDAASLLRDGLLHFAVIAVHLYFTSCRPGLGGQSLNDAVGGFVVARVNDADAAVMTNLFAGAIAVKHDDDAVGRMTVTMDKLGDKSRAGSSKVPRFDVTKRGAVLNDVVAINEDITAHGFASLLSLYPTTERICVQVRQTLDRKPPVWYHPTRSG
jgi:hypothetical protein